MLTLIQTAKLNDIDPQAGLADVLGDINDHKNLIDGFLKPRFLPTIRWTQFNYPIDILGKWHGTKYRFIQRYRSGFRRTLVEDCSIPFEHRKSATRCAHRMDTEFELMQRSIARSTEHEIITWRSPAGVENEEFDDKSFPWTIKKPRLGVHKQSSKKKLAKWLSGPRPHEHPAARPSPTSRYTISRAAFE